MSDQAVMIKPIPIVAGGSYTRAAGATGNQYFNATGAFISDATNTNNPRWDYDPVTLIPIGLRVEGAGTNYLANNPKFTGTGDYLFPFGGITDNGVDATVQAVDHTTGARKITVTIANSILRLASTTTNEGQGLSNGTVQNFYTGSVWIKSATAGASIPASASVNQDAAVPITITGTWQRVQATGSNLLHPYEFFELVLPVGVYYIWGGQVEDGKIATSFMTRARLAETCTAQMMCQTPTPATGTYADPPAWLSSNGYVTGNQVYVLSTLTIYQRINAATSTVDGTSPDLDTAGTKWIKVGPMNVWRAFDTSVQSQSQDSNYLVYSIAPGQLHDMLVLLNVAAVKVRVIVQNSAYDSEQNLTNRIVGNWSEYYFSEFEFRRDLVFTDLPIRANNRITIIVQNSGGGAAVGAIIVGRSKPIGQMMKGAEASIIDYSVKQNDAFGNITVTERASSKRNNHTILVPSYRLNPLFRMLDQYRAVAAVYIGAGNDFEPWIVWGYYRSFTIVLQYDAYYMCNLELESLT
jgi:hypothetical protein